MPMQVQHTTDYSKFLIMEGNRNLNPLHLKRLKSSMGEQYLISPIIVNEGMEVIDGQHRLSCCQELGLPVYYIICKGYGLTEIHRYNQNLKNWTMDDFMTAYIELGKKEYELYRQFKNRYGFGHEACLKLLTNSQDGESMKIFQNGKLRIPGYNKACVTAEKIITIKPYYEGWGRRSFVNALCRLLKNPDFLIEEFVDKLSFQQSKLYHCSTAEQYVSLIEEIYNYKRREKISLKFAA